MADNHCAQVRAWLQASAAGSLASPELVAHVADCAICQGALALTLAELTGVGQPAMRPGCERCLAELPEYVEANLEDPAAAARALPTVWWHLWTCPSCAEVFLLTHDMVLAERAGLLAAPPRATPAAATLQRGRQLLTLAREFLNAVLPSVGPALVPARGADPVGLVVADEITDAGTRVTVSLWQQPDRHWRMDVALDPPAAGWLVATLGLQQRRAAFDTNGTATLSDIEATLLAAPTGPDLALRLEPAEGA